MAKERIFKFIDRAAPEEEQIKEVTATSYKKAVKSYQSGAKSKLVEIEWTTKRGEEFFKLQSLPLGRSKKISR
jgi:hypothetical protein